MASVSVVVPCRNEERHIGTLLTALARQTSPPTDILIVDGGSTDATLDVIRRMTADLGGISVRIVVAPDARLPTAINLAVRESPGRVVVRFDGHSAPSVDYIARAVGHLADPSVGVVGGVWRIVPAL